MPVTGDAFGQALLNYHEGDADVRFVFERDDGFIDTAPADSMFTTLEHWTPAEREAVPLARGRVLDVGAGAGRHALYLQEQGHDVTAIDPSPLACEVCRARGVRDVLEVPLRKLATGAGPFDTVVMFGNNFGVLASPERAMRELRRLARMTSPDARILAASNNVYNPSVPPEHLDYHKRNRARGRWAGQIRLRVRYRTLATPWFDYLMVSPDEMRAICEDTPWHVERLVGDAEGLYVGVLAKRP